jgi:tRNA U34 5-methylaminomethyl-2-thiouridine-forming methyltransferase MnmC
MSEAGLILTEDGSHTLYNPEIGEPYHSIFGAIQESQHVFIDCGLYHTDGKKATLNVLEIGFGTGLNALLSLKWAQEHKTSIHYHSLEPHPLSLKDAAKLNYPELTGMNREDFITLHSPAEERIKINNYFNLKKSLLLIQDAELPADHFDVVFFDAFSPEVQPEMWTEDVFGKIAAATREGGILTTYSSKGIVKRALRSVGFKVERLPGPPGKREILRAVKE